MYDLPELRQQTRTLWHGIAAHLERHGSAIAAELLQPDDLAAHWREPDLLLSQTCGYPLLSLPSQVRVVATPAYAAPGCDGAFYRSALVVRHDHPAAGLAALRDGVCAINSRDSNSGMNLLRAAIAPLANRTRFFRHVLETGSHAASLDAVATGRADLAAIDCVTFALLQQHRPALTSMIRILGWTETAPGLPLITAGSVALRDRLREALAAVASDPAFEPIRRALLIDRFVVLPDDAYRSIQASEDQAIAAGYPILA
jgi:ABC-type phosphate/phosphonate transport system substrate-binding protein